MKLDCEGFDDLLKMGFLACANIHQKLKFWADFYAFVMRLMIDN